MVALARGMPRTVRSRRVILSTSWVRVLSFDDARERLPHELARRVIGATWHSAMNRHWWGGLSRYQKIQFHAKLHRVERWLTDYDNERGRKSTRIA